MSKELSVLDDIKSKIHTIRGLQVMVDRDLAKLYGISTKSLNQAVKRNKERFPEDFCFQLRPLEKEELVTNCDHLSELKFSYVLPLAFTEHGVAMLSSVLKSQKAVEININIMRAFITMKTFLAENKELIQDLYFVKSKIFEHDNKFEELFKALEDKNLPEKGIFFEGQVFDAYKFITDLIKSANKNIILIDNYADMQTLELLANKKINVKIKIYTKNTKHLEQANHKFNEQHQHLEIFKFEKSHDRFLIIDDDLYHIGASLKDLGKKWFAFSKLGIDSDLILSRSK